MNISIHIIIHILLLTLIFIKAIETIVINILPNFLEGKTRLDKFHENKINKNIIFAVSEYVKSRKNKMYINSALGRWLPSFISNFFYRWFILIPLCSISLFFIKDEIVIQASGIVIILSIFIEVLNDLVERLWNGVLSNISFNAHVNVAAYDINQHDLTPSGTAKRISISLIIRVIVLCLGFAAIYCSISPMKHCGIKGMDDCMDDGIRIIDSIYFSIVTITTTGYGDMNPTGVISKIVVVFQISLTWLLLFVNALLYGSTITDDFSLFKPNKANSADAKSRAAD